MKVKQWLLAVAVLSIGATVPVLAQKAYGPGVSDTEIKIGQTIAYSGPGSGYSVTGRIHAAYYKMLNETKGGINGRKINLLSIDDAYSPPKTVEVTRRLVESDQVLAIVGSMGTPTQTAVQKYLNAKGVPQIFIFASSPSLHDTKTTPWTVPFAFAYEIDGGILGKYVATAKPGGKIGILYQNDDVGKSYLKGFKKALGAQASQIVKEVSSEASDPTVDSQILQIEAAGADTFVALLSNKAQAQAIRKVGTMAWKPLYIVPYISNSITGVLTPAGLENAVGLISSFWFKTPSDAAWTHDKAMQEYLAFFAKYLPNEDPGDTTSVFTYMGVQLAALAIERCGDNLTRENLLKQSVGLSDVPLGMLLPGMTVQYSADSYYPIRQARMARFDGKSWQSTSALITVGR